ncbi:hypothetical protein M407DRAFT_5566 [Tulasnella calospora MUT 4182]|uniref:Rho-GAP domain-containing protein n=1 Tax=Tulasnella calospora MUT 4182 TaxID=1051891 RepID=A0A0C3QQ16_9AGAM|nr:hypothetical protein M407DRAFT_5566 [Tulasnella calospora MUT 4182]
MNSNVNDLRVKVDSIRMDGLRSGKEVTVKNAIGGREAARTLRAGSRPPVERSASNDSVGAARSKLAALLAEEGLSRDTLSRLDHRRVADSLALYQRAQAGSEPILASEFLAGGSPTDLVSAFSGSDDRPNWLTRLVVDMILGQVGKAEMKGEDGPGPDGSRTSSSTYVRAGAVARWIHVGERCLSNGDECSWKAIVAALCCIAIVRLEKVWKRVDERELQIMEDWVKGEKKLESDGVSVWFGDLRRAMADAIENARVMGQADRFNVAPLLGATKRLRDSLRRWEACAAVKKSQRQPTPDTHALVEFWARCRADPSPRLASINQMLPLSFAIESRQRGLYQPYFWKPHTTHSAAQSILPLLFPEPLPTVSLIDRNALIRTKKETLLGPVPGAEINEAQVQKLTNPNGRSKSRTPSRQRNIAEVDLDETLIPCFGGELVLKLPRDDGKSRPTSFVDSLFPNASPADGAKAPTRGNSIRLNTGSRLERKGSQMRLSRRSSLPSISQRNSLLIPDAPVVESSMRVTVKSGTIDRLVDVLVSGLDGVGVSHADDNGEMPLRDGKSKSFKVDRAEFARVWWTGFRSFVTPLVLFELLRKRFVGGQTARDPLAAALQRDSSPSGESTESPATTQLRLDVLSTLSYWFSVGGGAQDILDDLELYQSVQAFLNSDLPGTSPDVVAVRKSLFETFVSLTSLPVRDVTPPKEANGVESSTHRFGSQPPPLDDVTPDDLVSNLDCIAQTVFRGVTEANMFELADILETQTADRTGWFSLRDVSSQDDGAYPDIHVVGDCLRQWLRELPESIFTNHLYASFLEVIKIPDYDERKTQLRGLIWQLPQPNFDILRRLLEHLDLVVDNEEHNHMTPDSLAICFNVTLCKPPTLASFDNMQHTLSLVKHCILHYGYLFSELEPEFDEVLLEEEEPEEDAEDAKSSSGPESPTAPGGSPPDERGLLGSSPEANMTQTSFFTAPEASPVSPHSPPFEVSPGA